jgi:hypothetical protein
MEISIRSDQNLPQGENRTEYKRKEKTRGETTVLDQENSEIFVIQKELNG